MRRTRGNIVEAGKPMRSRLSFVVLSLVFPVVVCAGPALDFRAQRDLEILRKTLRERPVQEFSDNLTTFLNRYGFVAPLADLYMEWAGQQNTVKNAATVYAEVIKHWPKQGETEKAISTLSELMLLSEHWPYSELLETLRAYAQSLIDGESPMPDISAVILMTKAFQAVDEPGMADACITAALALPENTENADLLLLQAESYRLMENTEKASGQFYNLLNRTLSSRQKQAAALGFLRCSQRTDARYETVRKKLIEADPDGLTPQAFR